jgi:tRNA pseudouridine38-40 synthase
MVTPPIWWCWSWWTARRPDYGCRVTKVVDDARRYVSALVAYDGTDYSGFQYQANAPSIQCELERALDKVAGARGRVAGAGRTDAGVHANGQVIATRLNWGDSLDALQRAWNVNLPAAIRVRQVREAPEGFHPRFSAISRTYRYTVRHYAGEDARVAPKLSPLTDRFALFEVRPLDVTAMQKAAQHLLGDHDFATFGQPPQGESTVRRMVQAEWQAVEETLPMLAEYPGRRLVFTITANAFLRHMVRSLVGTLLAVGRGEWSPAEVAMALAARDRNRSAPPAPPQGLVLEKVTYPAELDALIVGK